MAVGTYHHVALELVVDIHVPKTANLQTTEVSRSVNESDNFCEISISVSIVSLDWPCSN